MTYDILYYNELDYTGLKTKFNKIIDFLRYGDFKSAEVKKLKPTKYLRAKLDDTNRLLFTPVRYQEKTYLLILEVIHNHKYEKSRFLKGHTTVNEDNIEDLVINLEDSIINETPQLANVTEGKPVHFLDKFIIFDNDQAESIHHLLPLILIGSAGSGKTSLMLEKLKTLEGNILYVSLSSYLVHNTRQLYYSHYYENNKQEVEFLSFHEFLETIKIQSGKEVETQDFLKWFYQQNKPKYLSDGRKIFEEFKGVITGSNADIAYLSQEEYLTLGVKQSIYLDSEKRDVYTLFKKYLSFLQENEFYDSNIIAHEYSNMVDKKYDIVLIDEVQDFTNSQLSLVLKSLKNQSRFFLCGDANQIVHPNFFSWSKLKSYFYKNTELASQDITRILTKNYRNTPEVVELANRVLKLKNFKFGSIDRESHYLIHSTAIDHGVVSCINAKSDLIKELNQKTSKSVKYAILVLHELDKIAAKAAFNTPLIFTPQEAKGLEYENVILYDFISREARYNEIARDITSNYLTTDFDYNRAKDKTDKALEIYKFYINSLYVVITRATKNIYLVESNPNHHFLNLLNINEIKYIDIQEDKSTLEDWTAEANKLAKQGKLEQMQAIEEQILNYTKIPWEIITADKYKELKKQCLLDFKQLNKKELIQLLNYAAIYDDNDMLEEMYNLGIKAAQNLDRVNTLLQEEYFSDYAYRNPRSMLDKVKHYGINFRNQFNLTPLMCASYMLNEGHITELLKQDITLTETDNNNRNAFIIMLSKLPNNTKITVQKISNIYEKICPSNISIQIDGKLAKIDANKAEFIFLNLIIARTNTIKSKTTKLAFNSSTILSRLERFYGGSAIPSYRIKRQFINAVLARNEVNSNYPYNLKLFKRLIQGRYILNHGLQIKINDSWAPIG